MATPSGGGVDPAPDAVSVPPLYMCQSASIEWTFTNSTPPYKVDVLSALPIQMNMNLASFTAQDRTVEWPEISLAGGWRVVVRVTNSSTTSFIESSTFTVLPCPVGGSCTCNALAVPGGGGSTTSSSSSTTPPSSIPDTSTPPSSAPPSTDPTSTSPSSTLPTSAPASSDPPATPGSPGTETVTETRTGGSGGLQSQRPSQGAPSSSSTGAIVGGVVGGVAFMVIVAALIIYLCRQRRRNKKVERFAITDEDAPYVYAPYAYRDDESMHELDHALQPDPYPYAPPMAGGHAPQPAGDWGDPQYSGEGSGAPSGTSSALAAGTDPASVVPKSTAVARVETKLDVERRRSQATAARPSPAPAAVPPTQSSVQQAEDAGFVQDGEEIPPTYRPEWEVEQQQRLGHRTL